MEKDTPTKVLTEISGKASWAGVQHGMRTMLVENDSEVRKYWMRLGSEIPDETMVQAGDQLGLEGELPLMIPIGHLRYKYPKKIPVKSSALCTIEGDCFGADRRFYILRMRFTLTENGEEYGDKYYLEHETLEENYYRADESILSFRKISNIASLYGFHENEIPSGFDDTSLQTWLDNMRQQGRIRFNSPYDILNSLRYTFDNFKLVFERRSLGIIVPDKKEIKTEKKDENVWEQYKEAAKMIIEHDRACEYCLRFIDEHATPCPEEFEPGSNCATLISLLVERHEAMEDYATCRKLIMLQNGFSIPKGLGAALMAFMRNGDVVLNYEKNCETCWKEIELMGMLALSPVVKKKEDDIDSLVLVEKMLNYFHGKGEFKRCEKLNLMKEKIISKRQEESDRQKKNNP